MSKPVKSKAKRGRSPKLEGSGTIAQGSDNVAAGAAGFAAGRDINLVIPGADSLVVKRVLEALDGQLEGNAGDKSLLPWLLAKVSNRCAESLAGKFSGEPYEVEMEWREPQDEGKPLPAGGILELFGNRDRLLFLGAPGSGKSVALLRLARALAARVGQAQTRAPQVPVYLSLSSRLSPWTSSYKDFATWFEVALTMNLSCGREDARRWIESDALLPILDDLHEVSPDDRPACVAAINHHLDRQGRGLIIAARPTVSETKRLNVQAVVDLMPLSEARAKALLAAAGPGLESLRVLVCEKAEVRELGRSPQMLRLMTDAYRNARAEDLGPILGSAAEALEKRVVEDYLKKMEERPGSTRYDRKRTRRALAWLARELTGDRFEIEQLQPAWLAPAWLLWVYAILSRGLAGGFMAAIFLIGFPHHWRLPLSGLVAGALVGVIDALPAWKAPASGQSRGSLWQSALRTLALGAAAFAVFLLLPHSWSALLGFTLALGFGLVFGSRPGGLRGDARVFETLRWGWSWNRGLAGAVCGALTGMAFAAISELFYDVNVPAYRRFVFWLVLSLGLGGFGFLAGATLGGLKAFPEVRTSPNQGLRRLLRNSLLVATRVAGFFTLLLWIPTLLTGERAGFTWETGALNGIGIGLLAGFWFGGIDLLQHFLLRFLLSAASPFPWRWVRFLDHAADRGLLSQVDGGYEFPFRVVRDYFSELPERLSEASPD